MAKFVLDSGVTNVDVIVNDGSTCVDTNNLTFEINTSNSIITPVILIQDSDSNQNIIKPCGSTTLDFNVLNSDSTLNIVGVFREIII